MPTVREEETFRNENGVVITYADVRRTMKGKPYTMTLRGFDLLAFASAVNQGIDARLQACYMPSRGDEVDQRTGDIIMSVESLPVLIRRLYEAADEDHANGLAAAIMQTLGFLDNGQWSDPDGEKA